MNMPIHSHSLRKTYLVAVTEWGSANLRFLGLVSVGAARSLDQTALRPSKHQNNPSNDVKYISINTHTKCTCQKNGNVHKNGKKKTL